MKIFVCGYWVGLQTRQCSVCRKESLQTRCVVVVTCIVIIIVTVFIIWNEYYCSAVSQKKLWEHLTVKNMSVLCSWALQWNTRWNSSFFSHCLKQASDGSVVRGNKLFHTWRPATPKARSPMVTQWVGGTSSTDVDAECIVVCSVSQQLGSASWQRFGSSCMRTRTMGLTYNLGQR